MIEVKEVNSNTFVVEVAEGDSKTEHIVALDDEYYGFLTQHKISKEELIKKAFEFLLDRESKESILSRFDLRVIQHYFPEFEDEIKAK